MSEHPRLFARSMIGAPGWGPGCRLDLEVVVVVVVVNVYPGMFAFVGLFVGSTVEGVLPRARESLES